MIIYIAYFGRYGATNEVAFNTETKRFTDRPNFIEEFWRGRTCVEARFSKDVEMLREKLVADGYECVDWKE